MKTKSENIKKEREKTRNRYGTRREENYKMAMTIKGKQKKQKMKKKMQNIEKTKENEKKDMGQNAKKITKWQ